MCVICSTLRVFEEPECGYTGLNATIVEVVDAPANTSTPYRIAVGDTFSGSVGFNGDRDWVGINLVAGQTYTISLAAAGAGVGTLSDAYLRVFNASGTQIAFNDDGGIGFDSRLTFVAGYTGTFFLEASGFMSSVGTYRLSVSGPPAPSAPSSTAPTAVAATNIDAMAAYLTDGYWADTGRAGRSWDTSTSNVIDVDITSLNAAGRQLARWAMEAWEGVANIRFREVSSGSDIRFIDSDSGAYAQSFTSGNNLTSVLVNVSTNWLSTYGTTADSYSLATYIHEIGHAIGLGHQGNYNNSATYGVSNRFTNDSWQMSIMSYFSQTDNTSINASFARLLTAMTVDIRAVQNLYGAPGSSSDTAGATVWGAGTNLNTYYARAFEAFLAGNTISGLYNGGPVALTIYDRSGTDTINLGSTTVGNRLDLRPGTFSDINGLTGNLGIHIGTIIERAAGGSAGDVIIGNSAANRIHGNGGADTLYGGSGNDTMYGGSGSDFLFGGSGRDVLYGGSGNDRIYGGTGNDNLHGGTGNDRLYGGSGNDRLYGDAGDDRLYGGAGNDQLYGGIGADRLYGGGGADLVYGGGGNDLIYGDAGADTLYGGAGRDTIYGGTGNDLVYGGGGNDAIYGGSGNDRLYGSEGNDRIYGGTGADRLYGGNGNDRLYGGNGNDLLYGGAGNDLLSGGRGSDNLWGGAGADQFLFARNHESTRVRDFRAAEGDRIVLDDNLWTGTRTASQVVSAFGSVVNGNVILNFGNGDVLRIDTFSNLSGLAALIDIV
jgi:serralysin